MLSGADRMALLAKENVDRLCHLFKLRRLAFRFDGKTKFICLMGFVLPGMMSVGSLWLTVLSVVIGLSVLAVVPILTGRQTLNLIKNRFGEDVAQEAYSHCELSRYMSNKTFTVGDIQKELAKRYELQRLNEADEAQPDDATINP